MYDALVQKYPGLTGDSTGSAVFQFTASPIAAGWKTGSDAAAYDIANAGSLNLGGFYDKGDAIDISYKDLILSVQPANHNDNSTYQDYLQQLSGLTASQAQTGQDASSAYQVWVAENPGPNGTASETQTQWLADPIGGASWQNQLKAVQDQINDSTGEIAALVVSMDGGLSRAQAAAITDTMPISQNGGSVIQVPAVTIDGDLGGDLARWAAYPDGQFDFQVVLDGSYTIKTPWQTLYTTDTSQHCWETNVTVNVDTSRIIDDVSYRLEVDVVGVENYTITRGTWYDPDYVNPSVTLTPSTSINSDTFFGLGGSLHRSLSCTSRRSSSRCRTIAISNSSWRTHPRISTGSISSVSSSHSTVSHRSSR